MDNRIPEDILEDILSRVDIVELIQGYIPLKRAGRNFKTNCPFHHEKTPSFMVSPDRQIYHCFGCGESGNAFKFLMRYDRMEFREAVEALAKKAGVILPEIKSEDQQTKNLTEQLYQINEIAASFYANLLHLKESSLIREYLIKRGIKYETAKLFKLGFAPDKWDALINYIRSKGYDLRSLDKTGLIVAKESGGYHDRFRNRVIYPIFDIKSRVIAFGARVLDDSLPKYLNSPETPLYVKGRNLYGFNLAKDSIRQNDFAVIVEGYMDCIIPFQHGLQNIVASLGTALTYEQVRLLKRYTHNVIVIFDPDAAGEMATLRSLDIFVEEGFTVKVVSLPKGFDPDSFVKKNGVEEFKKNISCAQNLFDYKLGLLKLRHGYKDIESKAKIVQEMLLTINRFKNAILKTEYLRKLAQELDLREEALIEELNKIKPDKTAALNFDSAGKNPKQEAHLTERLLVKLMLEEQKVISCVKDNLDPSDFCDEHVSKIVSLIFNLIADGKKVSPSSFVNYLDDEQSLRLICQGSLSADIADGDKEKVAMECINRLKSKKIKLKKQDLHNRIKVAQNSGDEESLHRLMHEFHHLIKANT